MATTKIKWTVPLSADILSSITDKISTMTSEGKTDGSIVKAYYIDNNLVVDNPVTNWSNAEANGQLRHVEGVRSWTDAPAAQEFVDFVSQFNPFSAEIVA